MNGETLINLIEKDEFESQIQSDKIDKSFIEYDEDVPSGGKLRWWKNIRQEE